MERQERISPVFCQSKYQNMGQRMPYDRKGMNTMKIGYFDSGIGGLSVMHDAMRRMPEEEFLFYMDTDHVPYGNKRKEDVIAYVKTATEFMLQNDCKAMVIACNTATAAAAEIVRKQYDIPIIGIEPAVKPAVEHCQNKRVLVIATELTVREEKLKNLINRVDDKHLVDLLPLQKLVYFAEQFQFDSPECFLYLKQAFSQFDLTQYSDLVLGCTHFNYFKDSYRRLIPEQMKIIDGVEGTNHQLQRILKERNLREKGAGGCTYYRSGRLVADAASLERIRILHQRLDSMERL